MRSLAYLILAHERPNQLARLVRALDCDGVVFFIHIDGKVDARPFLDALPPGPRVIYLDAAERVKVHWSGYSTVVATLNLLKAAMGSGSSFGRYALLSGSDFPIKPRETIRDALLGTRTEFIRIDHRIDVTADELFANRVKYIHLYDHPWFNPRTTPSRKLLAAAERALRLVPRGEFPKIELYQGSAWWALTGECVEQVFGYMREHPEYEAFHRHTCTPDEIFFHSIVAASPSRTRMSHDFEAADRDIEVVYDWDDHASHFIDWVTPGIELPKVLDIGDLERIRRSGAMFARKFREPASTGLIEALEEIVGSSP
jgi:hypothetical protein